jgi:ketosteroid isomerase-like protein
MKTRMIALSIVSLCLAAVAPALAEEPLTKPDTEKIHEDLRTFRKELTEAVLKGDVDKQLQFVSKDVVVTWQNGETVRGHDGLKEFWKKNQGGASKVFQGYKKPPEPTDLTILYGDSTGISYGTSVGQYNILGKEFELENRWTATLVKEDGRWVIASYHVSNNILDNPLLSAAKNYLYLVGGIALLAGLVLGLLVRSILGFFKGPTRAPAA